MFIYDLNSGVCDIACPTLPQLCLLPALLMGRCLCLISTLTNTNHFVYNQVSHMTSSD